MVPWNPLEQDSTLPSVRWSVSRVHFTFFCDFSSLISLLLPKWSCELRNDPCLPAPDFDSCVSSLVSQEKLWNWAIGWNFAWISNAIGWNFAWTSHMGLCANKARYTAMPVAADGQGWIWGHLNIWAEAVGPKTAKNKKSKVWRVDQRTDGRTNKVGCSRVARY